MLRTALPLLVTAMLVLLPDGASGQLRAAPANDATPTTVGTSSSPESVAARLSPAGTPRAFRAPGPTAVLDLALTHEKDEREAATTPALQNRDGGGIPFMVAGGALFIAGAVVGGDAGTLLMVGGAGVGAYGLYVYFGGS